MDDVFLGKMATIERCLRRVRDEYARDPENLRNITRQDSVVLNLQRACEAAIDLAMHIVSARRLGVPKMTRDAFQMLADARLVSGDVTHRMKKMVGFRNIAVHDYQAIDLAILQHICDARLDDFNEFVQELREAELLND